MSSNFLKGFLTGSLVSSSLLLVGLWLVHSSQYFSSSSRPYIVIEEIKEKVEGSLGSDKEKTDDNKKDLTDEKKDDPAYGDGHMSNI